MPTHLCRVELESGLDDIRQSPQDFGIVKLIVRRPAENAREILANAELEVDEGLVGDRWHRRVSSEVPEGKANLDTQLTLMNARAANLIAVSGDRWELAGDQLFVDLDLSNHNLPPGTRLKMGSALIEVTAEPHRGCAKFRERFGLEALRFVNSKVGCELNLRGIYAKVVHSGIVRSGDSVKKHLR